MFINLNANKEFRFGIIIYHLKRNLAIGKYPTKKAKEPIVISS